MKMYFRLSSVTTILFLLSFINVAQLEETENSSNDCGRVIEDQQLRRKRVIGGDSAKPGEVPWHAGVYTKTYVPFKQICGGSLISKNMVLTGATCFWNQIERQQRPAADYAVAVGTLYRPWNNSMDVNGQRSDVKEIHLPFLFQGYHNNYQEDIAIVVVSTPFEYNSYVRPVCLNFDVNLEKKQLVSGNLGKLAGWGLTAANGQPSQVLNVINLPYIDTKTCIEESPVSFLSFINSANFCAGYKEGGKAVCKGDSGGGLAFPELDGTTERYYLRGLLSTAPRNEELCNEYAYAVFTHVAKLETFIKMFWKGY